MGTWRSCDALRAYPIWCAVHSLQMATLYTLVVPFAKNHLPTDHQSLGWCMRRDCSDRSWSLKCCCCSSSGESAPVLHLSINLFSLSLLDFHSPIIDVSGRF
ncbi:hypothetical protein BDN70DRAFT_494404 [Pholiota conissans]|uniref:Uncharacterized protein n=1 Tax=Pholiota conissans TaxID=109636 RepID=A0A9P6CU41_9AGAR|nr:hypothetical protein BDN70DRAFT_494404 [Pholiota conissans]